MQQIADTFYVLFTCETKIEEIAAIRKLMLLGLTKQQIDNGIIAGARYIKRRIK